jgi:hypothetical protein
MKTLLRTSAVCMRIRRILISRIRSIPAPQARRLKPPCVRRLACVPERSTLLDSLPSSAAATLCGYSKLVCGSRLHRQGSGKVADAGVGDSFTLFYQSSSHMISGGHNCVAKP